MQPSSPPLERIAHAALLHDVGKLAIPEEVLEKDGPLTREEWEVMSEHPIVGERILARTKELAALAPIVRHEHEHWNGTGYPDGLEKTRIPVGSRVILEIPPAKGYGKEGNEAAGIKGTDTLFFVVDILAAK